MPGGGTGSAAPVFDDVWPELAAEQNGVVARRQLLGAGLTRGQASRAIRLKNWRPAFPGVYYTFTGPVPARSRIRAALLVAGKGAVASHRTALFLIGAINQLPSTIDVTIPQARRTAPVRGVRIHRGRRLTPYPGGSLPRTSIEDAVLDTTMLSDNAAVVLDLVLRVVQKRLTTPQRMEAALRGRTRHRWRTLVHDLIGDSAAGVLSALERLYLHSVERAHGLPAANRNLHDARIHGASRYWDADYEDWDTLVELDGLAYHPDEERFLDRRKENAGTLSGRRVLHYGWREVHSTRCQVAAEVGSMLKRQGWAGRLRPCGPACSAAKAA